MRGETADVWAKKKCAAQSSAAQTFYRDLGDCGDMFGVHGHGECQRPHVRKDHEILSVRYGSDVFVVQFGRGLAERFYIR